MIVVPIAWVAGFDAVTPATPRIGQVDGALVQVNLNLVFLACADQVGAASPYTFLGRSVVADSYGRPVADPLNPWVPAVVVVEVDLAEVQAARHRGPGISPLDDRRTDLYGELFGYHPP